MTIFLSRFNPHEHIQYSINSRLSGFTHLRNAPEALGSNTRKTNKIFAWVGKKGSHTSLQRK